MDKVQKTIGSQCYTPSSEHFRIYTIRLIKPCKTEETDRREGEVVHIVTDTASITGTKNDRSEGRHADAARLFGTCSLEAR
jgi:hypothetical protein